MKMISNRYPWIISCLYLFFLHPLAGYEKTLPTYFTYTSDELKTLESLPSNHTMSLEDLQRWDHFVEEATKNEAAASLSLFRLYTYLYTAQAEAAKLSYNAKGQFAGSLDPISYATLNFFFPEFHPPADFINDTFSNALAKIVFDKIRKRLEKEDSQTNKFEVPEEKKTVYSVGLSVARWIPWYTTPIQAFWPPPPPPPKDPFWKEQIAQIHEMQTPLTEEKKKAINFWAGLSGAGSGDWRKIANQYIFEHNVPLMSALQARSLLMQGLYDGMIVGFTSKYHFLTMRPKEYDPSVNNIIPVPKHPSYPANHAILASISATILSNFFPTETKHWHALEEQSGLSRIWSAVHYPYDVRKGHEVGIKIGEYVLAKNKN